MVGLPFLTAPTRPFHLTPPPNVPPPLRNKALLKALINRSFPLRPYFWGGPWIPSSTNHIHPPVPKSSGHLQICGRTAAGTTHVVPNLSKLRISLASTFGCIHQKPRCSMYGLFTYIWVVLGVNVGKYTIHWASGKLNGTLSTDP